jgi:hypothetical protein
VRPSIATAALLLGLIVAWGAGILNIKTPDGIIVLEDLPDQAMVLLDEKKVTVHWPDGGGSAEITMAPGDHTVQVKKDGITTLDQKVTIEDGGRKMFTALREPLESPLSKIRDADDGSARPGIAKPPMPPTFGAVVTTAPTPPRIKATNPHTESSVVADNNTRDGGRTDRTRAAKSTVPPVNLPTDPPKLITNSIGMKLALVPDGEFMMGSDATDVDAYDNEFLDKESGWTK